MASTGSPEASEIRRRGRRRLIGAIALAMLLVVFVPMMLDSEPRPERSRPPAAIPPRENAPPLPAPAPAKPLAPPPTAPAAAAAEMRVAIAPPKPAPAEPRAAGGVQRLQGFAVQVGAFRDEAKLKQAREKLAAAGVVHYIERLDSSAGPLTRLRAGPFATREEAEAAGVRLKRATIEGKVVPLP